MACVVHTTPDGKVTSVVGDDGSNWDFTVQADAAPELAPEATPAPAVEAPAAAEAAPAETPAPVEGEGSDTQATA